MTPIICLHCGATFTPEAKRKNRKYCSKPCSIKGNSFNGNGAKFRQVPRVVK